MPLYISMSIFILLSITVHVLNILPYFLLGRPSVSPPRLSTRPNSNVWTRPYTDLGLRGNNSVRDDDVERYDTTD